MATLPDFGFRQNLWWPDDLEPRCDFDVDDFLTGLANNGLVATWWAAARCPCNTTESSDPFRLCPICHGEGWEFHNQQTVRIVTVGVRRAIEWQNRPVIFDTGTMYATVRAEHAPAKYDRIVLEDARIGISNLWSRRSSVANPIETLRYPVAPLVYNDCDGNEVTAGVVHMRASNAEKRGAGPILVQGVDFDVTKDGQIDFTRGDQLGTAPSAPDSPGEDGGLFSMYYYTRPHYRVDDWPHVLRDTRAQAEDIEAPKHVMLPVQFTARLEWLVTGQGDP